MLNIKDGEVKEYLTSFCFWYVAMMGVGRWAVNPKFIGIGGGCNAGMILWPYTVIHKEID